MLTLYNFLTRKKEIFKPIYRNKVGLYTCGPTVYNYAHIGNLRTYIFEDILRRTLEYAGYKVKHVMNITDVDDKIIKGANAENKNIYDFSESYKKAFFNDIKKLHILPAWKYPDATKHIKEMITLIQKLLKSRFAYKVGGSVYFDISKFKSYGNLSRLKKRELKIGARVDTDEYAKNTGEDFVLWKAVRAGEPSWPARFAGEARPLWGRPGWHIECSAMSMKYFGKSFDIHAGAIDLLFPHHENEIAQSEGATGKKFVKYFLEGEHLLVNGKRMAKSAGNFFTLRDLEKKGFNPLAFRYFTLSAHYRSQLNFTLESLKAAQNSLERLWEFVLNLKATPLSLKPGFKSPKKPGFFPSGAVLIKVREAFQSALFDDLNTPKALAVLWNLINDYNKNPKKFDARAILGLLYDFDKVLGLGLRAVRPVRPPKEVLSLLKKREIARKAGNFAIADEIRRKIKQLGWQVKDTPSRPELIHA
ncbi:cysteine--tRNA ligase [Candidatus Giovannonibacteria bacterium RIFCSPLOWO2_01_FULL_44_40]|uniref:Cysteine--tRNA ligase n=1 Tax=Candidatus Giovannonibacteria bacterium RIFCSPHIGHO2_01_FULL_45_23 TaxID=1798325 RepID=A0A1F5VE82_9BACT|nr:MAG: cysteine--tRNA ligase [Candidatus Giovannonibacteria bacterium RIFCSPHIGHO2_01_FULL_45_23]OGF75269.1 MAG: cysteine--tRNA ligase [Candidatus Giovannonibacteria bacterium RIFCSPHIGHO2_02_FULL_45_13]OGF79944.1 MAG: cysteine--tRNA ligase [Candidatus Giovannonibacteria bacterium RIFCSPLOWO2_01_FULL_44_40]